MHLAPLDAAAGKPDAEAVGMMITAVATLRTRRPAELAAPEDERRIEQAALGEIGEQAGDGEVGLVAATACPGHIVGVRVPRLASHEQLDVADATFDEAAGHQAAR